MLCAYPVTYPFLLQRWPWWGVASPPPPRAMGCNRNRPDINTTTVGGRGGTGGLCIPVVIAPSRRARRGGGVWEMDIRDPPWAQANFPPPPDELHHSVCIFFFAFCTILYLEAGLSAPLWTMGTFLPSCLEYSGCKQLSCHTR